MPDGFVPAGAVFLVDFGTRVLKPGPCGYIALLQPSDPFVRIVGIQLMSRLLFILPSALGVWIEVLL